CSVITLQSGAYYTDFCVGDSISGLDSTSERYRQSMPARKKTSQVQHHTNWITAASILAMALPVCLPLFTSQLPAGHEAFFYHPRLVEFHENIGNWIFLPRWAPDLGAGSGQPLFIFSPPLPYYIAEVWHLLGFDVIVSFNLAAVVAIIASAWFMFLFADY